MWQGPENKGCQAFYDPLLLCQRQLAAAARNKRIRVEDSGIAIKGVTEGRTYLIDSKGIIRARWLDRVHHRVNGEQILIALKKLNKKK